MSLPTEGLKRRQYIDVIRRAYNKWINWDPSQEIRLGTYGTFDDDTGVFVPEGNIYDPAFEKELNRHNLTIRMANHPPEVGPMESDVLLVSREIKEKELNLEELDVPGIADAPIKAQWTFNEGKTDGIIAMHNPHQVFIPPRVVLEHLYKVDRLIGKYLINVIHVTDAYTFYLSDKSASTVSLALIPNQPKSETSGDAANAKGGFHWWADAPTGLLRQASDPTGECSFTPVYGAVRPIRRIRRFFRDKIRPEPALDELWFNEGPTWEPLDEDGELDPLDPEVTAVDPFSFVEAEHRAKCDGCSNCSPITVFD